MYHMSYSTERNNSLVRLFLKVVIGVKDKIKQNTTVKTFSQILCGGGLMK